MKQKITTLLLSTGRDGMQNLLEYLEKSKFFESPASTKYHGCHDGGLAEHSFNVYLQFHMLNNMMGLGVSEDSVIIAALLHDACKANYYIKQGDKYTTNKMHPKGHGVLSVKICEAFIRLTEQEKFMIKFHMGMYGINEYWYIKEYSLGELDACFNMRPECKFLYFADEMATRAEKIKDGG